MLPKRCNVGLVEKVRLLPSNEPIHFMALKLFDQYSSLKLIQVEHAEICKLLDKRIFQKFSIVGCQNPKEPEVVEVSTQISLILR